MFLRPRPAPLLSSCAVLLSIALAACGGGSSSNSAAAKQKDREQQFVKFAKCLREHGINVSTPTGSPAIHFSGTNPRAMEAAQNACVRLRPAPPSEKMTPAERAARQDAALKFARCMRSHGVNVPDPKVGNGAIAIQATGPRGSGGSGGGPNPSSPTFQAAQNACQGLLGKNLPRLSTKGGPGGGASGGPGSGATLNYGAGG